ncbi:MAG: type ISP restriction/modification enzyme [Bacteroidales bacterium]
MEKQNNSNAAVFHFDLFGKRDDKYNFLSENNVGNIPWNELNPDDQNAFLVPKDFNQESEYNNGFKIVDLMPLKSSGIKTHDDANFVSNSRQDLKKNIDKLNEIFDPKKVYNYSYRPFDNGYIYYDTKLLGRAREKTIYHLKKENIAIILVAQPQAANLTFFDCLFLTNSMCDTNMYRRGGPSAFPLYSYTNNDTDDELKLISDRSPNLNIEIISTFASTLNLRFTNEKEETPGTFAPIDILDYIYAVLHSPAYRAKYKEFLKIDFPRVPYPENAAQFWALVKLGGELRQLHLLESPKVNDYITQYPVAGDNVVEKLKYEAGRVYINDTQYFDNVPEIAWNFYIGGYQPAQKWLKDRKGRTLTFDDILHYQRVIVALVETDRVMGEVDVILKI